jgi:PHD/YefM family antitoxin component YafN of YafNO toxin-antitoxin module
MIDLTNSHPLSDFNRNAEEHVQRLKDTGLPEVLTVNGQAEVVVQSAAAYQKLLDAAELAEILPILRQSMAEAKRGEGRPARDVLRDLAAKAGFEIDK